MKKITAYEPFESQHIKLPRKLAYKLLSFSTPIVLGTFAVLVSDVVFPSAAHAWFTICNKSSSSLSVAFAYMDAPDIRSYCNNVIGSCPPLPPSGRVWNSEGWWSLDSDDCAQVYPHELTKRNSVYYVHAQSSDGSTWGGGNSFCTLSSVFTLAFANSRCDYGEWKIFKEVRTGNARNYTYNLTD